MAIEVEIAAHIERAIDDVFGAVADIDTWPRWLIASGIVAIHRSQGAAGTPPTVGEAMTIEQRAAGRAGTFAVTVTAVESGRRLALDGRDGDGVKIAIDARLTPALTGQSGTDLRWSFRIDLPFRYRVFESMAAPQVRRAAALDIEALRQRLESTATG